MKNVVLICKINRGSEETEVLIRSIILKVLKEEI